MNIITNFVDIATGLLQQFGPISGVFLVVLESIIPALPLGVFITLNMNAFGVFFGFLISYIATILGCMLSYSIFLFLGEKILPYLKKKEKYQKLLDLRIKIKNMPFSNFVTLVALPFTPASLLNVAAGLSSMNFLKFTISLFLGKIFIVFFWGYVGTSFIDSITNFNTLVTIILMILFVYKISKLVGKKFHIE